MAKKKREITSVRIPADQLVHIRAAAFLEGKDVSTWVRDVAVEAAGAPVEPEED